MFFLNKKDIEDFQNRCVVAIFLDYHAEVTFSSYIDRNHIRGTVSDREYDIFLFNSPKGHSENVIVYRSRKAKEKENIRYQLFNFPFLEEYLTFVENPYEYIKENFDELSWENKYDGLFISNPPREKELYKYKMDPNSDDSESERIFNEFIDGDLTFVDPDTCNDPFDCDCEINYTDNWAILLFKAILKTRYGNAAPKINLERLKKYIEEFFPDNKAELLKVDQLKEIISNIYLNDNKYIDDNKINLIIKNINMMYDQTKNIKKEFRILCMAKNPKDILMWGYYGNSGKGLCVEHSCDNIVDAIGKRGSGCICIYGNVNYPDNNKKPKLKSNTIDMNDDIFNYIVECTFTKFYSWKNEEEFRFVLIGKNLNDKYIPVRSHVDNYYLGCKNSDVPFYSSTNWPIRPIFLHKDTKEYKLVEQ